MAQTLMSLGIQFTDSFLKLVFIDGNQFTNIFKTTLIGQKISNKLKQQVKHITIESLVAVVKQTWYLLAGPKDLPEISIDAVA